MLLDKSAPNGKPAAPADERLVALAKPRSFEADQFRRLRLQLERLAVSRNLRAVAVTSAVAADGKTLTAVNLAGTLAAYSNKRVVIVDADMRRPSVAKTLGVPNGPGLTALLETPTLALKDVVQRAPGANLDVLTCESSRADTYDVLTSARFTSLLEGLKRAYDFVIVDTPPVTPVPDTALLHRVVDGYLVVVSANSTPRKLLGEALNLLDPASVLGLVFNRDRRPLFGFYRSSYSRYFQSYERSLDGAAGSGGQAHA